MHEALSQAKPHEVRKELESLRVHILDRARSQLQSHNPRPGAVELPPVRPGTPVTFSSSIDYPGAFHRHTWDGVAQEYTHSGPERHDHLFVFAGPTTADDVERIPLHIHVHTFNDTPDSAQ